MMIRNFKKLFFLASCSFFSISANALCTLGFTDLYSGPKNYFVKNWIVPKHTPLKLVEKKGQWLKVKEVDGVISYVKTKDVTSQFYCGIVKVEKLNARSGPGLKYKLSKSPSFLTYDSTVRILRLKKRWIKVKNFDDKVFWLYRQKVWIY